MHDKISKDEVYDIISLTGLQQGMLFHYLKEKDSSLYMTQIKIHLTGIINNKILEEAFNKVAEKNEVLMSVFRWEGLSEPLQIILKNRKFNINYFDLSKESQINIDCFMNDHINKERESGFILDCFPLIRIDLLQTGEKKYVLLLHYHHILFDGWSLGIFIRELFHLYDSIVVKTRFTFPEKLQYKEYLIYLKHIEKDKAFKYWKDYLFDYENDLRLPMTTKMNENKSTLAFLESKIRQDTFENLNKVCKNQYTTLSTLINIAWGILLSRYCSSTDVVFGSVVSGRPEDLPGIKNTMGMFINTIPIRIKIHEDKSIKDLIHQVTQDAIKLKEYDLISLTEIKSGINFSGTGNLFDTIVVFENYYIDNTDDNFTQFQIKSYEDKEHNSYDISLIVYQDKLLNFKIEYNAEKFSKSIIQNMLNHFTNILHIISEDQRQIASKIMFLDASEYDYLVEKVNQTDAKYPQTRVAELFLLQAAKTPNLLAVTFKKKSLTYNELNQRANNVASWLRKFGIINNRIISIMLDMSLEMITAIMGVLISGGAYLPIDTNYPVKRCQHILQDSRSDILITDSQYMIQFESLHLNIININDIIDSTAEKNNEESKEYNPKQNDLAYIIYTSGSTGDPKGIMIEQDAFTEFVTWAVKEYGHKEGYQVLLSNSYAFDSSIQQIFPPLVTGGTLHLLDADIRSDGERYLKYLHDNKINNIDEIPVVMNIVLDAIHLMDKKEELLQDMLCLSLGSEYVPIELVRNCRKYLNKSCKIINGYGPAESSVEACTYHFDGYDNEEISLIGKPRSNTKIYIVDEYMNICPIGVAGELLISGKGLARGYINNKKLTDEKFIKNIFSDNENDSLYKTGDLVRWAENKNVEFLGRLDNQIKIRGYRIELEEIESKIKNYSHIVDAVIKDFYDNFNEKYLVAFIVKKETFNQDDFKQFLKETLPKYMIPEDFVYLNKLPLTPNSKVDRKALAKPDKKMKVKEPATQLINEYQQKVFNIWTTLLGKSSFSINDNFFEIGGNSILMMRLLNELKKNFKEQKIEIADLFIYNSVALQAEKLENITKEQQREETLAKKSLHDIAIIGMASVLPGAENKEEFWNNINSGIESIREIPESRIKLDPNYYKGKEYIKYGYIEGIDLFDPEFFGISPREAKNMDPHHRIMLEITNLAICDAGYSREQLMNSNTGVYIGAILPAYLNYVDAGIDELMTSNLPSYLSGRISYHMGFCGPSMVIDTACSSTAVALHEAVRTLRNQECDSAIVGGVHVEIEPVEQHLIENSNIASRDYKTRAFSDDANGTIGGEGCIAIYLKPLKNAIMDGDRIYSVIKGSGIQQDGKRANGISSPSPVGQAEAIISAWKDSGIRPDSISYIEAHGTGTPIGDPIEVKGLKLAFEKYTNKKSFAAMGSVKSNIGHLDNLAGLASVLKVSLMLKRGILPPSINITKPNHLIDFIDSPIYLNRRKQEWKSGKDEIRTAGINSFGLSGTNVHIILQEYKSEILEGINNDQPITLSTYYNNRSFWNVKNMGGRLKKIDIAQENEFDYSNIYHEINWEPAKLSVNLLEKAVLKAEEIFILIGFEDKIMLLEDKLSKFVSIIRVIPSKRIEGKKDDKIYYVNADSANSYKQVFEEIKKKAVLIRGVINLIGLEASEFMYIDQKSIERTEEYIQLLVNSVLGSYQVLSSGLRDLPKFIFLTQNAIDTKMDVFAKIEPAKSIMTSLISNMHRENKEIEALMLDIDENWKYNGLNLSEIVLCELLNSEQIGIVAYRDNKRLIGKFAPYQNKKNRKYEKTVKEGGVYILAGGTGGIGTEICRELSSKYHVNLAIISRTRFPDMETWKKLLESKDTNHNLKKKITIYQNIIRSGSNIKFYTADVSIFDELELVINQIKFDYGRIHGVFHLALAYSRKALADLDYQDFVYAMKPKINGIISLDLLTREQFLDFFVAFSSLDAVFSEKLVAAYSSANTFLDSYAIMSRNAGRHFLSIRWGTWNESELVRRNDKSNDQPNTKMISESISRLSPLILGFNNELGIKYLNDIMTRDISSLIVTGINEDDIDDLNSYQLFKIDKNAFHMQDETKKTIDALSYEDVLEKVRKIYIDVLQLEDFSNEDDYYELGGDSIIGVELVLDLSKEFGIKLDASVSFKYTNVIALAEYIHGLINKGKAKSMLQIPKAKPIQINER